MEINTCEQYVLNRMNEVEEKNVQLEASLKLMADQAEHYKTVYEKLCNTLKSMVEPSYACTVLKFTYTYADYDVERYNYLCKELGIDPKTLKPTQTTNEEETENVEQ